MDKISFIIVNYNSTDYLISCVKSILNKVHGNYEIILVDNNSSEEEKKKLDDKLFSNKMIKIVYLSNNLGFAKANNIGVKKSSGSILHFLNPDVLIKEDIYPIYKKVERNGIYSTTLYEKGVLLADGHIIHTVGSYIKSFVTKKKISLVHWSQYHYATKDL